MMLALLTGCGSKSAKSDTEYVKKNGKLIVGITDYEPMDYKDENGEWTGFDAEFARMFAKELGVDCELSSLPTGVRNSSSWIPRTSTPSGTA